MKRCRCCRQSWPIEFYAPVGRWRRSTCLACRTNCGEARKRQNVARTQAYKAQIRAQVEAVRLARARATWDNDAAEYSGPIAHNAQRPSVRLYSEREGVGFPEYRRNA